ncbi:hypothetical protein FBULB1_11329 [Fusarium bulbicola]|nr:hypothetical protein FBULB1_11329 [Fusarium bulbicola]
MDATSSKKTQKETWKRHNLFDRGFFYDDEVSPNGLPDHIEALRKSMLSVAGNDFGQEVSDLDEVFADQVTDLTDREVDEEDWKHFLRKAFFEPLKWEHQLAFDANTRWVIFNPKENRLGSAIPDRLNNESAPQPDFAFYFPIHRPPANPPMPLEPDQELAAFSLSALRELYVNGLRPSPFDPFQKNLKQKYLKCFPWLVIECKPKPGSNGSIRQKKEEVYCQAVNGTGCAVRLNEIAALHEMKLPDQVHIPPIPAVTTVGPEVKVWITYLTENSLAYRYDTKKEKQITGKGYMMQCIWDGDMRNSDDIAKFRLILENIHAWATVKFKPLLAKYLEQWRWLNSDAFLNTKIAAVAFRKQEIESRSRQQSPEADETPTKRLNRTINAMISLNLNEAVTPNSIRDKSPASACTTPQSGLRRSARIKAIREAQLSPGPTPQLERSASRLKATIAAGPVKRRESGTKFLAASIEVEVDGSTSDEEYEEVEECDESGEEDEECEDNDEADEEESDGENLVWDYVRRNQLTGILFGRNFPAASRRATEGTGVGLRAAGSPGLELLGSSLEALVVCGMTWDRDDLDNKGFFFDDSIRTTIPWAPFPPHVEALRQSMLDFTCQDFDATSEEDAATQHYAERYSEGGYSESDWEHFFRNHFFDPLVKNVSRSLVKADSGLPEDSRRISRCNYYYDKVVSDTDALWEAFNGKSDEVDNSTPHRFENVKCPKPDYAFYLPMYHLNTNFRIPGITNHKDREWHKTPTPSIMESFSWSNLKRLYKAGLRPTPFRVFHKEPREKDLKCYPWLLVEYKKAKYTNHERQQLEETVCCQAANGSASAIKLNQIAARYAIELPDGSHIPPIPVVTTVGSEVKVWITYLAKDCMVLCGGRFSYSSRWEKRSQAYMMNCIWKGDMTIPQDIVKFRLILENTYTWATRVFKPLITTYIDQWRFVHSRGGLDSTSATLALARRQQTMELSGSVLPLIQGVLDRQSSLELDDSLHHRLTPMLMGVLVQQIFAAERQTLTREMDRIVAEKVKSLSLNAGTCSCPCTSNARRAATGGQTQESSQATTVNVEDPKDDDYVDSQSHRSGSSDSTPSTPTGELRRSTRLNPQVPSPLPSTPSGQTPRTPDAGSRAGKAPLFSSLPKAPESQSSYSRPVVESESYNDPGRSTTSGDRDTNTVDVEVTPLPSPSAASSTIFTPTEDESAPRLSPKGPALGKACHYAKDHADASPKTSINGLMSQGHVDLATELDMHRTDKFPSSYFLDSEIFQPISRNVLTRHDGPFFLGQQRRFATAGTFDSLIQHYENSIHHWLPMLSVKRPRQDSQALEYSNQGIVNVLIFLALEALVSQSDEHAISPQSNPSYLKAKHGSYIAESGGAINIRLIQTLTLVAFLARLLLYNEYACNEPSFGTARERLAAEVEMQQIALASIQHIVSKTIPQMARQIVSASQRQSKGPRHSPILASCLYHAATECAWFVKENHDAEMVAGSEAITQALQVLKSEWAVCAKSALPARPAPTLTFPHLLHSWEDLSYDEFVSSFETNVFGPIKVTRAVLPHMRARKSGTMVFTSSLSGWVGHQFTGAYAGSKFALEGVVESLHNETKALGLRTLLMEPGRFRTPLLLTGHLQSKQSQIPDYESASEIHHNHLHVGDLKQPGNPEKFVAIVLDLVRREGCAQGKSIPFRLPVGKDAVEEIGAKVKDVLETMQEWDSIITETDY